MGTLEKFLIGVREREIQDIKANIEMAKNAGKVGTALRKLNCYGTVKMSNAQYIRFLQRMIRQRERELKALRQFKELV